MLNTIEIGNTIAERRRKAGLTQEGLIDLVGEENISLSTLKRIESGHGHLDMARLLRISQALQCELEDLVDAGSLRNTVEPWFSLPEDEKEVEDLLYLQKLFYPEPCGSVYYRHRNIKTLMQFLLYLPLIDETQLWQVLWLIAGSMFGQESYLLDKLEQLFLRIPDSEAKQYADYEANRCTYDYFVKFHTDRATDLEELLKNKELQDKLFSWHEAYISAIEKKRDRAEVLAK